MEASRRRSLRKNERGTSAFEYALVSAVFAMAVLGAMNLVSGEASQQLAATQGRLSNSASMTGPGAGGGS